jgi:hypothetical protein
MQHRDDERHKNDWPEIEYCSLDEAGAHQDGDKDKEDDRDDRIVIILENVNADKGSLRASISAPSSFGFGIIFGIIFGAVGAIAANHYIVNIINSST